MFQGKEWFVKINFLQVFWDGIKFTSKNFKSHQDGIKVHKTDTK